jgi:hypothetical protein
MALKATSSLAKDYDPLYSSSPLASLDGFSRSHGDGLYVMQLVVAATNQNGLYKKHMFCRKNVNKIKMQKIVSPHDCDSIKQICTISRYTIRTKRLYEEILSIIISSQFSGHSNERKRKPLVDWLKMTSLQGE